MKLYTNPKHLDKPKQSKKVNTNDVILLLAFTFIFVLPTINLIIEKHF